jgi:hypothetical protein
MTNGIEKDVAINRRMENYVLTKGARTLLGICSGLTADGTLNDTEIVFLRTWLTENASVATIWPGDVIANRIEIVLADGLITADERADLLDLLTSISGQEFQETGSAAVSGPALPLDPTGDIQFDGRSFCFTGTFFFGTRAACERAVTTLGGTPSGSVTGDLDYLVIGGGCSAQWANTTYGRKIETAIERKKRYGKPLIIGEQAWHAAMTVVNP